MESKEEAKLALDDYKYKHANFWSIFFKSVAAFVFLISVPVVNSGKIDSRYLYLIPICTSLLTIISWWILCAEYKRLRRVEHIYRELSNKFIPDEIRLKKIPGVFGWPIGIFVTTVWLTCGLFVSTLALYFLWVGPQ